MNNNILPAGRPGIPNPIDIHVGERLRLRRSMLGMSQRVLADALGITFQQIQKYESGNNRMSASRLYDISCILNVPMQFFFDDMPESIMRQSPRLRAGLPQPQDDYHQATDPLLRKETLEFVRAFYRIQSSSIRSHILGLCTSMANIYSTNIIVDKNDDEKTSS